MKNIFEISPDGYVIGRTGNGDQFIFDIEDFGLVANHTWGISPAGYVVAKKMGKTIRLHRMIIKPSSGLEVDHINGIKTDNRRINLRECTRQQNNANINKSLKLKASTKYKGVSLQKSGKYRAMIGYNNERIHLGYFITAEEAAKAYNEKAIELYGEFARQNII